MNRSLHLSSFLTSSQGAAWLFIITIIITGITPLG